MRRMTRGRVWWFAPVLASSLSMVSCTLDIAAPVLPPPETWAPALNTHPDSAAFQALLDRYVSDGLPGTVLLVRTPEGQWNGAAGFAKIETGESMLPTNRFCAASITKMYMATAVMLLVEDGLIQLDARIRDYLPGSIYGRVPNGAEATVRQLLGHTSGIPDFSGVSAYDLDTLNDPLGPLPAERLLSYLHGQSPIFAAGTGYFYSNANYLLLALIVGQVTGASHADVVTQRILQPLGLEATYYKNESGYPAPPGLVNSYEDLAGDGRLMNVSDLTVHSAETSMGYAGLIATSADYADFIDALLEGRVVGAASLSLMKEHTRSPSYGLGLSFLQTPYGPAIGHSGGDVGVLSQVRHFPDVGATLVLLVNGGDSGVPDALFKRLWDDAMDVALARRIE